MEYDLIVDHLKAVQDKEYAAEVSRKIKEFTSTLGVKPILALHESDDSCCSLESWPITSSRLLADSVASMTGDSRENVQAKLAEHEPSILLVGGSEPSPRDED
jgi:hypothetical protein